MAIEYTWNVDRLDCYPEIDGKVNVVFLVCWRAGAVDGGYSASHNGTTSIVYAAGNAFTDYADLTQDQVISWVRAALGSDIVLDVEDSLAKNIADQANPPIRSPALPWIA